MHLLMLCLCICVGACKSSYPNLGDVPEHPKKGEFTSEASKQELLTNLEADRQAALEKKSTL